MDHSFKIPVIVFLLISSALALTSCKKKDTIPTLTTVSVSGITQTSAVSGGNVTSDGGAEVTARGVCWGTSHNPTTSSDKTEDGTGAGAFTSNLAGLRANITYYVRAYAINSQGTSYGNEVSFATSQINLATLTTTDVTSITHSAAISGGDITDDGGGTITARGVCWSTAQNPKTADNETKDGSGTGSFISSITGLTANTTYYVRAYATNGAGTVYGNQINFTTNAGIAAIIFNSNLTYGTGSDIDGNVYKTIQIGSQTWMAENLKTSKYNDGTSIPFINDQSWDTVFSPGYCFYDDSIGYKAIYGALYNWFAVNTGKLCPTGWHVPTDAEWHKLVLFLDPNALLDDNYTTESETAGNKLKEIGSAHWIGNNPEVTNESGFTALPSGYREGTGGFWNIDDRSYWLTSTEYDQLNVWTHSMYSSDGGVGRIHEAYGGCSKCYAEPVRCIKN